MSSGSLIELSLWVVGVSFPTPHDLAPLLLQGIQGCSLRAPFALFSGSQLTWTTVRQEPWLYRVELETAWAATYSVLSLLLAVEDLAGINVWVARVSPSNPSDILSRKIVSSMESRNGTLRPACKAKCLGESLDDG